MEFDNQLQERGNRFHVGRGGGWTGETAVGGSEGLGLVPCPLPVLDLGHFFLISLHLSVPPLQNRVDDPYLERLNKIMLVKPPAQASPTQGDVCSEHLRVWVQFPVVASEMNPPLGGQRLPETLSPIHTQTRGQK